MQLLPVQIFLLICEEMEMNIEAIYEQLKEVKQELDFARLQETAATKLVATHEKKMRELVTQLAKASGVSVGNNTKATKLVYTEADDAKLRDMWIQGVTAREIGEALGKNSASVNSRIVRLGLSRRPRVKKLAA